MSKRFTDTEKFKDPWYRRLDSKHKTLWEFLLASCDHAGIISIDLEFVDMVLNEKYADSVIQDFFSDRVIHIKGFKYFIPKFIQFQYGKLNPKSKVHSSVIDKLQREGINPITLSIEYEESNQTTKDKAKAKDKDKEKEEQIIDTASPVDSFGIHDVQQMWNEFDSQHFIGCPDFFPEMIQDFAKLKGVYGLTRDRWQKYFLALSETAWVQDIGIGLSTALKESTFQKLTSGTYPPAKVKEAPQWQ